MVRVGFGISDLRKFEDEDHGVCEVSIDTPINYPTDRTASETSDGFQSKRQPAVPTSEATAWLHAEPWSVRSRKLLRSEVSNITHVEETYSKGIEILKVRELCLKTRIGQLLNHIQNL